MNLKQFNICFHVFVMVLFNLALVEILTAGIFKGKSYYYKSKIIQTAWNHKEFLLSIWISTFQYIYFAIYLVIDIIEFYYKKDEKWQKIVLTLQNVASYLLFAIVFPISLVVLILFWSIYFWDRDLLYPEYMNDLVDPWVNHVIHTLPVPWSVIYMMTSNTNEPSKLYTCSGAILFVTVYFYGFYNIYATYGVWVYMGLANFTQMQRKCIFLFSITGPIIFHSLGFKLNAILKSLKNKYNFSGKSSAIHIKWKRLSGQVLDG